MGRYYKKFGDPLEGIEKGAQDGILRVALNVENRAKVLAPVDKGQLRDSIGVNGIGQTTAIPQISKGDNESIYVGSAVEYASYQEFGTRKMAAQPFLRPAIELEAKGRSAASVMKYYQTKDVTESIKKGVKVVKL